MRQSLLVCALVVALCSAQSLFEALPSCAVQCVAQYLPQSSCTATDVNCLCSDNNLLTATATCTKINCTVRDTLAAKNITSIACHAPIRDDSRTIASLAPAMAAAAFAFVAIRLTARWKTLGWDDGCICFAWLTGLVASILNALMSNYGLGKDIWTVSHDDISQMLFLFYVSEPFYLASTVLTKIGICLFLLKIFPFRSFRITMWVVGGVCAATGVAFALALIFQCSPVHYSWLFWDGEVRGTCIDRNAGTWAHACVNIVLDLVILIIPLVQLYTRSLQSSYSTRKKVQIMIMFSVGIIVTVVSVLRLRSLIVFMKSHNFTWDNLGTAEWSIVEIHVGIICACLPSARVFFGRILPKLLGVTTNESKYGPPAYMDPRARSKPKVMSWNRITTMGSINGERDQGHIKDIHDSIKLDEVGSDCNSSTAPITNGT